MKSNVGESVSKIQNFNCELCVGMRKQSECRILFLQSEA